MRKQEIGITLIALVVTIVVLLILAGVSIAMLGGENGIITQAQNAKEETEKAGALEKIQIEVLGAIDNFGKVDVVKLKENVLTNLGAASTFYDENLIIDYCGYKFVVTPKGEVSIITPLSELVTSSNYGDNIIYQANNIENWKIFYNDGNNVYIIASDYIPISSLNEISDFNTTGDYMITWNNSNEIVSIDSNIIEKYMLEWFKTNSNSRNVNINAVAILMDTDIWDIFVDNEVASSAIGTPTIEMFCESWNSKNYNKLFCNNSTTSGYYIGDTNIPNTYNYVVSEYKDYLSYDLYFPHTTNTSDGCWGYWIASPSATKSTNLMFINAGGNISYRSYSAGAAIRPVVCLKDFITGFQDKETKTWTIY